MENEKKFKVLIAQDISAAGKKYLVENGCEIVHGSGTTENVLCKDIEECDAVIARTAEYTKRVIDAGKKLKVISRYGVGVDNIDWAYAEEKGIWVTNVPHGNSNSVAEHTIYLILACAKNGSYVERKLRNGNFEVRNEILGIELKDKILGLIGLGHIGKLVAQKAIDGFGMNVIAYDPFLTPGVLENGVKIFDNIDEVYQNADFISLHLPLNEKTRNSVGMDQFNKMKDSAYLINAARGGIIAEDELVEALNKGIIKGAGLDVYRKEPVEEGNPFLRMDNITITPHYAAMTEDATKNMGLAAARDVVAVLRGEKPAFPVNHPDGI